MGNISVDEADILYGKNSHKFLNHTMLRGELRQYIISKVKAPLMKFLIFIAKRYPTPTEVNCLNPNSRLLLKKMEKFFTLEDNSMREEMFRAAWKIIICEYEHDQYYRYRLDWLLEELVEEVLKGNWHPRPLKKPRFCWKEQGEYGEFRNRDFKQYIK